MSSIRSFCRYWLPPIIWMAAIFSASSDSHSWQHSSRILAPLLHWLFPHLSDAARDHAIYFFRKCAHLSEYALLALLFWRALRKPVRNDPRPWSWPLAGLSVLLVLFYASTDEFHQLFVPTREGRVSDVLIDTAGGAIGMVAFWAVRKLWTKNPKAE